MKDFSIKKILILVTILAVPGFLYYLLKECGKNRYKPLAIYGPKVVAKTTHSLRGTAIPDTIYHTISDFKLLNQLGDTVSFDNYKGKIILMTAYGELDTISKAKELGLGYYIAKPFDLNVMRGILEEICQGFTNLTA